VTKSILKLKSLMFKRRSKLGASVLLHEVLRTNTASYLSRMVECCFHTCGSNTRRILSTYAWLWVLLKSRYINKRYVNASLFVCRQI